jgi:hypothetical protein
LRAQYRRSLPHLTALALGGIGALAIVLTISIAVYLRNARRFHLLPEGQAANAIVGVSRISDIIASMLTTRPASRAGFLFLFRTIAGSPSHRVYVTAFMATGLALVITIAPDAFGGRLGIGSIRTSELVAQTLMLTAVVAGFRAAIRSAADPRAAWLFGVAESAGHGEFRKGVRLGVITAVVATVSVLFPLHAAAWGPAIATAHAVNGVALGWLLVEVGSADIEQPLVWTIPPSDGLNTVGVVLLGVTVIVVLVLGAIEKAALATIGGTVAFAGTLLVAAAAVRYFGERNHRAVALSQGLVLLRKFLVDDRREGFERHGAGDQPSVDKKGRSRFDAERRRFRHVLLHLDFECRIVPIFIESREVQSQLLRVSPQVVSRELLLIGEEPVVILPEFSLVPRCFSRHRGVHCM